MKMSFRNYILHEENFASFQQYLQQSGMSFPQLLQKLQSNQPSGKGGNAYFYKIPGTQFGVRVSRRNPNADSAAELTAAHDPHEGENVGQPVAHYGKNIEVLRLQSGTPAGFPFGLPKNNATAEQEGVQTFRNQIINAAKMPDQEYERLFSQIIRLNQRGYGIDPSKSGNLLIDPHTNKFNIVDLMTSSPDENFRPDAGSILTMLMSNSNFHKYFHSDREMQSYAQQIIKKIESAAKKTGFPLDRNSSSTDYSYKLANGQVEPPD